MCSHSWYPLLPVPVLPDCGGLYLQAVHRAEGRLAARQVALGRGPNEGSVNFGGAFG